MTLFAVPDCWQWLLLLITDTVSVVHMCLGNASPHLQGLLCLLVCKLSLTSGVALPWLRSKAPHATQNARWTWLHHISSSTLHRPLSLLSLQGPLCQMYLSLLDEACVIWGFAGWTTEGDSAFNELSGSSPLSIRQQALRGIAKVALERGDKQAARHQYERILGKALIGQGPPAAHWAHSEYAWLLFEDGNLEVSYQAQQSALLQAVVGITVQLPCHVLPLDSRIRLCTLCRLLCCAMMCPAGCRSASLAWEGPDCCVATAMWWSFWVDIGLKCGTKHAGSVLFALRLSRVAT